MYGFLTRSVASGALFSRQAASCEKAVVPISASTSASDERPGAHSALPSASAAALLKVELLRQTELTPVCQASSSEASRSMSSGSQSRSITSVAPAGSSGGASAAAGAHSGALETAPLESSREVRRAPRAREAAGAPPAPPPESS